MLILESNSSSSSYFTSYTPPKPSSNIISNHTIIHNHIPDSESKPRSDQEYRDRVFILDATAFYAGIPFLSSCKYYTTQKVIKEVKHIKQRVDAVNILISTGNLTVLEPSDEYAARAKAYVKEIGERDLSDADISIIALALMLNEFSCYLVTIITDDYAIANVANAIGIDVSYVMSKGIKHVGRWVKYCKSCKLYYHDANMRICKICGNKLKARLIKNKT